MLPHLGELDEAMGAFASRDAVLELGCGGGRMTRRLLDAGCRVTAVDAAARRS